jgi:hypothetical protein
LKRKLAAIAVGAALLAAPQAAARTPAGFFGISPQGSLERNDFELMRESGIRSVRLPLFWSQIERFSPYFVPPDWFGFDRDVALAAANGMRIFPFVWGTPSWLASLQKVEPDRPEARRAWASFLRRAERRYGPGGVFWRENPDLPYLPIRMWEIWNEENIVTFSRQPDPRRFARLIRVSGRILHRMDPGSQVIIGGLFGRPLQIPPNVASGDFLNRLYRARNVKDHFDGVALHPYVADARAMRGQIRNLRRIMRRHHDAGARIYVTELGWGSDSYESRWERGLRGQARELNGAFRMLAGHRRSWRIGGAWWFSWSDVSGCIFCDSAGLLTAGREAKPSWYSFNAWTGGDAGTVPRARFAPGD